MEIIAVVAASTNNAIGQNNDLLWRLPNDLKFLKTTTWGMPVAMGRKTFESIQCKPLKGRPNIVITRNTQAQWPDVLVAHSVPHAVEIAQQYAYKKLFILGGAEIYLQSIPLLTSLYITRVHAEFPEADAYFPEVPSTSFELIEQQNFTPDDKHAFAYSFEYWKRK
jgi:dihydrofolate reductase